MQWVYKYTRVELATFQISHASLSSFHCQFASILTVISAVNLFSPRLKQYPNLKRGLVNLIYSLQQAIPDLFLRMYPASIFTS